MVQFIAVLEPAQNADRILDRRLADEHWLKTALQRRVLLDIFLIFIERRRANAMQFAARQSRLEQVRRIHRAIALASPNQRVHLVDKQDDLALSAAHLIEHALQALLKLAAIFGTRNQRAHIQRHQPAMLEAVGHIAIGDPQRQPLGNRRLADARLTDQRRVVLGAPRQNLDGPADFLVTANHRVQLAIARRLRQIAGVFLHRLILVFSRGIVGAAPAGQL